MMMIRPYLLTLRTEFSPMRKSNDCTFLRALRWLSSSSIYGTVPPCFNWIFLVRPFFGDYWPTPYFIQFGQSLLFFFSLFYHIQRLSFLAWLLRIHSQLAHARALSLSLFPPTYIDSSFVRLLDVMSKWWHRWNLSMREMKRNTTWGLEFLFSSSSSSSSPSSSPFLSLPEQRDTQESIE